MRPHLLYFPCRGTVFDWFSEFSGSGKPQVTTELLMEQWTFEHGSQNAYAGRVTCASCENPAAKYVICQRQGKLAAKLYPRRFPHTKSLHLPECYSYHAELIPDGGVEATNGTEVFPSGDFAALWRDLGDPELRAARVARARQERTHDGAALTRKIGGRKATMGLRRFACELLQHSGVCDWRPNYLGCRDERVFNGLVKGALTELAQGASADRAHSLVRGLPAGTQLVPWSFLDERHLKAPAALSKCVGFGFVQTLGEPNQLGARELILSNHPDLPLLIPGAVLSEDAKDPRSPLQGEPTGFVWVIFVAALHGGVWKIHHLICFRVSAVGLIPVDSRNEELMVERLVAEGRAFKRWLRTPPGLRGRKFVPDFQLLDTPLQEYVEVAGMMSLPEYAREMAAKAEVLGPRLLVWNSAGPLANFIVPPASGTITADHRRYRAGKGLAAGAKSPDGLPRDLV